MQPHRPKNLSPYAEECLLAIAERGLAHVVSVGGAVGLMHYLEYRQTHDVDAWWTATASGAERQSLVQVVTDVLRSHGEVSTRSWGDVTSIELRQEGTTVFSFQVAERSALLEPPQPEPSTAVLVDSLDDLIAAKMVALIERGAPRDFRDIYMLCRQGLATPDHCWHCWKRRQELVASDHDQKRARTAIETHLIRIEMHRPLQAITSPEARAEAATLRACSGRSSSMPATDTTAPLWLDGTLYPDEPLPHLPLSAADRCDFLARLCSAWDFGLLPYTETLDEVRRPQWRQAIDTCRILTSPAYHLLRRWHHLDPLPYLGQQLAYIRDDPELNHV